MSVARWFLHDVVLPEIAWLLRWTIRLVVLGALVAAVARMWLVPAAQAWLTEQRAAVAAEMRQAVTPDLPRLPDLGSIRDHLTGGTR
jgi:type II secretory pathway component PulL